MRFLSGPIGVEGAEPGDLLVVDLLDVGAKPDSLWGFNGFFSKQNGGGFLTDHFPLAQKSIWGISGLYTHSRQLPGVKCAGLIHPGLIGCLPDQKLLDTWNKREVDFIATNPTRVPPLANPPFAKTAHAGKATGAAKEKVGAEGARTVPPREHGGNCDIKDLSRGSKTYFPVRLSGLRRRGAACPADGAEFLLRVDRAAHGERRQRAGSVGAKVGRQVQGAAPPRRLRVLLRTLGGSR